MIERLYRLYNSVYDYLSGPIEVSAMYVRTDPLTIDFAKNINRYCTYSSSDGRCNFEQALAFCDGIDPNDGLSDSHHGNILRKIVQRINEDQKDLAAMHLSCICITRKSYRGIPALVLENSDPEGDGKYMIYVSEVDA